MKTILYRLNKTNHSSRNLGAWIGSFTRLSSREKSKQAPHSHPGRSEWSSTVRQQYTAFSPRATGEVVQEKVLEYSSLNRVMLFFENGAFSQGSIQFGPFGSWCWTRFHNGARHAWCNCLTQIVICRRWFVNIDWIRSGRTSAFDF